MSAEAPEKACTKCAEVKSLDDFGRDKRHRDGRESACRECERARARARRATAEGKARAAAYHAAHRNERRARLAARHRERPWEVAARHARQRGFPIVDDTICLDSLRARDGDRCHYCDVVLDFSPKSPGFTHAPTTATIEHTTPAHRGGEHSYRATVLTCWQCDAQKNDRTAPEYAQFRRERGLTLASRWSLPVYVGHTPAPANDAPASLMAGGALVYAGGASGTGRDAYALAV